MKKKIITLVSIVTVLIVVVGGILIWDYNNPIAVLDTTSLEGYDVPLYSTLTKNRFITNKKLLKEADEFNKSVDADYIAFLENYERPCNIKVNIVEEDGKLIVTYFGTATQNGKEVEYLEQRTYDIDFATEIRGSVDLPTK